MKYDKFAIARHAHVELNAETRCGGGAESGK